MNTSQTYVPNHLVWAILSTLFCCLPLTWAAKTIDTMPNGKQQNMVVRMAQRMGAGQSDATATGNNRVRMKGAARRTRMREYIGCSLMKLTCGIGRRHVVFSRESG